ncbi:alpha/beta hydrolase, partial [Cribrihabitans sp. XS_ASV171]
QLEGTDVVDLSAMPMEEIRAQLRARYQPAIDSALSETGIHCARAEIAGVPCLILDPPGRVQGRVVLYGFGGGFTVGSPEEDLPISARLAVRIGSRIVAPAYRLAPEHPFPAALDDMVSVVASLLQGRDRLAMIGESAGATLVLATLHRLRRQGLATPACAALMSPATDMGAIGHSGEIACDPSLSPLRVAQVAKAYAPDGELTDPEISPLFGPFDTSFPPVLLTTGTRDLFLSQSSRLARVMRAAGAPVDLRVWEGMWHVFEFYDMPEARASLSEIADFVTARLTTTAT